MNRHVALVSGASIGAGILLLAGEARPRGAAAMLGETKSRWSALGASLRSWLGYPPRHKQILEQRVRDRLYQVVSHPGAIQITIQDGEVIVSGPVLAGEVDRAVQAISELPGVKKVVNRLEIHQDPGKVPGLQGRPKPGARGRYPEGMPVPWMPTSRAIAAGAGGALAIYGARERTLYGAALAAVGLALLARGLADRQLSRLLGTETRPHDGRRPRLLREVMTPQVEVIQPDASVEEAAEKMRSLDVGVLPVCENDRLVGMVTDRDLVIRILAAKRDLKTAAVREAMTPGIVYCFEDDDIGRAARLMEERQIRRLIVLNRDKRLVGIVSLGDLAVHTRETALSGEVLEAISEPAHPKR